MFVVGSVVVVVVGGGGVVSLVIIWVVCSGEKGEWVLLRLKKY